MMIESIIGVIVVISGWIASKPRITRFLVKLAFKFGVRQVLKVVRKYHDSFPDGSQEHSDMTDIIEAIVILARLLGEKLGFEIKPKMLEPHRNKESRKYEKKKIKQTWKDKRKAFKMKQKSITRDRRKALRDSGLIALIAIIACAWCIDTPAAELSSPAAAEPAEWSYLTHYALGVAWDATDGDQHSIVFASIVTWRDLVNFDLGLVDFEKTEASGDLWWNDLNPAGGISIDLIRAAALIPQLQTAVDWVPGWIGVGAGVYLTLENPWSSNTFIYAVIKW